MKKQVVTFRHYWSIAKSLGPEERAKFFASFNKDEKEQIKNSYHQGGWKDVFLYNKIDKICDEIKEFYDVDLFDLRIRVLTKNERILVDKDMWNDIMSRFSEYDACFDLNLIFGGIFSKTHSFNPNFFELHKGK